MKAYTIMRIEGDRRDIKCLDGELRTRYYEFTDQGTMIQYLANGEDSPEEYIIENKVKFENGLTSPYIFSIVEERNISFASYTPQANVGATAAFGAALGGTAGAIIGAATAAQANANAASVDIPISYTNGLSYLLFNGERINKIHVFPYPDSLQELLGQSAPGFSFDNKWIEETFGKTRGFNGKYTLNFYGKSTSGDTLQKHAVFYNKFITYFCENRFEIGALNAHLEQKDIQFDPVDVMSSDTAKTELEILRFNAEQTQKEEEWYASKVIELKQQKEEKIQEEKRIHGEFCAARWDKLQEIEAQIHSTEQELSALGFFKRKQKKELTERLELYQTARKGHINESDKAEQAFKQQINSLNSYFEELEDSYKKQAKDLFPQKAVNHRLNTFVVELSKECSKKTDDIHDWVSTAYALYKIIKAKPGISSVEIKDLLQKANLLEPIRADLLFDALSRTGDKGTITKVYLKYKIPLWHDLDIDDAVYFFDELEDVQQNVSVEAPSFLMSVENTFSLPGNSTVVTGVVQSGEIRVNDFVQLLHNGQKKYTLQVVKLQTFTVDQTFAKAGDRIGILFQNISKTDFIKGDQIVK